MSPIDSRKRFAGLGFVAGTALAVLAAGVPTGANAGGGGLPQGSEAVRLDPADFTTRIDNPYWPMRPGSRWVYEETEDGGGEVGRLRDRWRVHASTRCSSSQASRSSGRNLTSRPILT